MAFTFFFRDTHTLRLIERFVIPELRNRKYMDVWDAGCAMGPEPYSLAIIFRENMGPFLFRNLRLYATDIDESGDFGEVIRRGVYPNEQVKRIPKQILSRYFAPVGENGSWQIAEELRSRVFFERHDLLSLQSIRAGLGLILCKNVLLHFQEQQRSDVITMFHHALADGGFLVMEQTQHMPDELLPLFERVTHEGQVHRKRTHGAS